MDKDHPTISAGIIPLSKQNGQWNVLLISHCGYEQYWCCPKGHVEPFENHQDAARRELKEETNLDIQRFFQETPLVEEFTYPKKGKSIFKRVLYFIAEVKGTVALQREEIADGQWFSLPDAIEKIEHPEGKATLRKVLRILESNNWEPKL